MSSRDPTSTARSLASLHLDDSDAEDPFDTPGQVKKPADRSRQPSRGTAQDQQQPTSRPTQNSRNLDSSTARETSLQAELTSVRSINTVIASLITSLEQSRNNMETVHRTVTSASTLLNTWTRILSQTEHNQRLILNPNWQGATQDAEDVENESVLRQQAVERRAADEDRRREEALARQSVQEDEKKRGSGGQAAGTSGTRGRVRSSGYGRGASGTSNAPGYVGVGGQTERGRSSSRAGSGIGRGTVGSRGRGRGVG